MLFLISGRIGLTDHLTAIVGALGSPVRAAETSKVGHETSIPEKWGDFRDTRRGVRDETCVRLACNEVSAGVFADGAGNSIGSAQRSDVPHLSVFPDKS